MDQKRRGIHQTRRHCPRRQGFDAGRIVAGGASAGGHLATILGTAGTSEAAVRGVINYYGPGDLLTMPPNVPSPDNGSEKLVATHGARLLGGPVHERPDLARQASGIFHVTADDPPFLILHGSADPLVPLDQSRRLDAALRMAGVASRLMILEGAGHGGPAFETEETRQAIRAFLAEAAR
jgi:acetyl esterase/lipase